MQAGRGRDAITPSWMTPPGSQPQPPGMPQMRSPMFPGGGGPLPGPPGGPLPGPPGQPSAWPGQGQGLPGPPGPFPGPPGAGPPGSFPGPPQGVHGGGPQGQHHGPPGGGPPPGHQHPLGAGPPPGQPQQPGHMMQPGMHGPRPGMGMGPPPGAFPGMQMMQPPPPMGLPPGAIPPPMQGPPFRPPGGFPVGPRPPGMGMPPPGMLPPGAVMPPGMLPPGATPPPQFQGMPPPHQQQQQQQQPGQAAAPAPAPAPAAANGANPSKSAWTEHTSPEGRKYYYNAQTKASAWEKPAELLSPQEKAETPTPWKEHTAPDGRKYYYNKETKESKWTMPEEMKKAKAGQDAPPAAAAAAGAAAVVKQESKVQTVTLGAPADTELVAKVASPAAETKTATPVPEIDMSKYQYSTKNEAKAAFKELLASVHCSSEWGWEQALRLIVNDPRYGALKSLGEKKQCFNEYVIQRRNEEKEEERKRIKQAREDFLQLIVDSRELKLTHSYRRAKEIFEDETRWKAVPEREREDLFHEGQKEKDRREKEEKRADKKRKAAAFRELLESISSIQVGTEWRKVAKKLEGEEVFEALDKVDRLEVYQEYQKELERRDREEKEREKEVKRRDERQARDNFKALLTKLRSQGLINVKTRWKEFSKHVVEEEEYKALESSSSGSRPKELFEFFIEDVEAEYEVAKVVIKELMKQASVAVTSSSMAEEEFFSQLLEVERKGKAKEDGEGHDEEEVKEDSKLAKLDPDFKSMYFKELLGRAKVREEEEAERKRRAKDKFGIMLRHLRKLEAETTWEQFVADYDQEPEYRALGAEESQPIFEEYVLKLKRKAEKRREEDGSDEEGRRKRDSDDDSHKKHKKKSSRKHERSEDEEEEDRKSRKRKHKDKKDRRDKDKDRDRSRSYSEPPAAADAAGDD